MDLRLGARSPEVKALQLKLRRLGWPLTGTGYYWHKTESVVIEFQQKYGLTVDGWAGPQTLAEVDRQIKVLDALPKAPKAPNSPDTKLFFGAPWVGINLPVLGLYETDKRLNAVYVPGWKLLGLPKYPTLAGNTHAWCSVREFMDKYLVGLKDQLKGITAGAASWSPWGRKCPYWFGATLDIRHAKGGRHVGDFLYWINEKKKIAAVLSGNSGNRFCVAPYNLSGNDKGHDEVYRGPRWASDWPDGQLVSMEDVLKAYPMLKVGGSSNSTR